MTESVQPADVVDDGVTDVLTDDEVVHVPAAVAEMVGSIEHHGETFLADVPDWDAPDRDAPDRDALIRDTSNRDEPVPLP